MIQVTETAAKRIKMLMTKQGLVEGGLRVGIKGGGCSGLSYTFAWETAPRLGDEVIEGPEVLRQPAIEAAMQMLWVPATRDHQPVSVWISYPLHFDVQWGGKP